jgi:carboxyl-terminal processing protease
VGEKTFGDGSQQRTFELADGAALILSVAKFQTPSGKKFQDEGLTPGTPVASAAEVAAADDDGDDEGDGASSTATVNSSKPAVPKAQGLKSDDQLTKALDLLKAKAA